MGEADIHWSQKPSARSLIIIHYQMLKNCNDFATCGGNMYIWSPLEDARSFMAHVLCMQDNM